MRHLAIYAAPAARLPIHPFVRPFVGLMYCGQLGWVTMKVLAYSLALRSPNVGDLVQGEHPQISGGMGVGWLF